jgi:hypothetical protein
MADLSSDRALLSEVQEGAEAMALLGENEETFRAAVDAFRAEDGESMQLLLTRHGLGERCEAVCHWLRSKECVLLCLELSGPPMPGEEPPGIREFAEAVAKVTADEELLQQVVIAIEERDADAWSALVRLDELERFSHLLCHWACTIHFRLVCEVVCRPLGAGSVELPAELRAAGQAIGRFLANEEGFAGAVEAVTAGNCEGLRTSLDQTGLASLARPVCEWLCSWQCMHLCLGLCRTFPIERPESPIEEMLEFARDTGPLAAEQGTLERLSAAVLREDDATLQQLLTEHKFERYCLQFAHWVCFLRCQIFCICVSSPTTEAFFTHIGALNYSTDIASLPGANGLTTADRRGFFDTLHLNGGISVVDGAPAVEYRFETISTSAEGSPTGSWLAISGAQIIPTQIGSFIRSIPVAPFFEEIAVVVNNPAGSVPGSVYSITPTADGWIQVPPLVPTGEPMVPTGTTGWQFLARETLLFLDTTQTLPSSVVSIEEAGVAAGESAKTESPPGTQSLQTDVHFGIRMKLRDVGDKGEGGEAGTCEHIAINNTSYNDISHHPYWQGGLWNKDPLHDSEIAVCSIGIAELAANPCSDLTDSMTVQFTAAHSNLGEVKVWMEGPGGPYAFTLEPDAASTPGENLFGTASPSGWTFAEIPACAYLLKLSVDVLLTTGETDIQPEPYVDYIAFCKSSG